MSKTVNCITDVRVVQFLKVGFDSAVVDILKEEQERGKKKGEFAPRKIFCVLFAGSDGFMEAAWCQHQTKVVECLVAKHNGCGFRLCAVAAVDKLPCKAKVAS